MTRTATIVGGGPAGLIAAQTLAYAGVRVTIYDLRRSLGRKFLLAGRGGLNITHSEPHEELLARYESDEPKLRRAIEDFDPDALRQWCADLGEPTFVGSSGRVFPASFRAAPLLRSWLRHLGALGVVFHPGHRWLGWEQGQPTRLRFERSGGETVVAGDCVVLAFGGASWPGVSSDGAWAADLEQLGIGVAPLQPSNCGIQVRWTEVFRERFEGTPLKNVAVALEGQPVRGDVMITQGGMEGGPIYALAPAIRRSLRAAHGDTPTTLAVDLMPDLTSDRLAERLRSKRPKESVSRWLRRCGFSPGATGLLREATGNDVPIDPPELAGLVKGVPVKIVALMPIERAISTAGGVRFSEIDDSFMLRSAPGVFVAGEMLDYDAPTGGYLLQAAFSTGVAAARGALEWMGE